MADSFWCNELNRLIFSWSSRLTWMSSPPAEASSSLVNYSINDQISEIPQRLQIIITETHHATLHFFFWRSWRSYDGGCFCCCSLEMFGLVMGVPWRRSYWLNSGLIFELFMRARAITLLGFRCTTFEDTTVLHLSCCKYACTWGRYSKALPDSIWSNLKVYDLSWCTP